MQRLLASPDTVFLEYLRRLLAARDIGAFVRNPTSAGLAAGEVSSVVAPPELWVTPEDFRAAERILRETEAAFTARGGSSWRCPRCGETLEPQFEICWRCGTERREQEAPREGGNL